MIAPADSAFEQRIERIAVGEAQPVVGSEGDAARSLDRRDRFVQAERGDQIGTLARRSDDDHRAPSVAGREVAPEQAIDDIDTPWAFLTALTYSRAPPQTNRSAPGRDKWGQVIL